MLVGGDNGQGHGRRSLGLMGVASLVCVLTVGALCLYGIPERKENRHQIINSDKVTVLGAFYMGEWGGGELPHILLEKG